MPMNNQDHSTALAMKLMEANRSADMFRQLINQYKEVMPEIPDEFWDDIDTSEVLSRILPIYVKHLTNEDMDAAMTFFNSPEGQNILDKSPAILAESMKVGEQWGMELGEKWEAQHDMERA